MQVTCEEGWILADISDIAATDKLRVVVGCDNRDRLTLALLDESLVDDAIDFVCRLDLRRRQGGGRRRGRARRVVDEMIELERGAQKPAIFQRFEGEAAKRKPAGRFPMRPTAHREEGGSVARGLSWNGPVLLRHCVCSRIISCRGPR